MSKLTDHLVADGMNELLKRSFKDGGFAGRVGGDYRTDATAWAAIALAASGASPERTQSTRSRLVKNQLEDGRVCLLRELPEVCWPTPLAVMAWNGSEAHKGPQRKAIDFLLSYQGLHPPKGKDSPVGHDTTIKGWPWIENTHSWVEPTTLVLLSLELAGFAEHPRSKEARRMLINRQLASGGWNYGNTKVFERALRPMPESTGMALNALAGKLSKNSVVKSIAYLKASVEHLTTPLSLCWSLLGLGAWGEFPQQADALLKTCFNNQRIIGPYETFQLSLFLTSLKSEKGFVAAL